MWEGVIDKVSRSGLFLLNPQNFKNGLLIEKGQISLLVLVIFIIWGIIIFPVFLNSSSLTEMLLLLGRDVATKCLITAKSST